MKFFTIENSEGSFTININEISTISKYKAKDYPIFDGLHSGEIYHNPERYIVEVGDHKFGIKENDYKDIRRLMLQEMEKENGN